MRELTLNQSRVLERIREQVQKGTKVSVTAAMRGIYSPSTATRPEKITRLPQYHELLQELFPDDKLIRIHKELLYQRRYSTIYEKTKIGNKWKVVSRLIDTGPETPTVLYALNLAYKLKGYL